MIWEEAKIENIQLESYDRSSQSGGLGSAWSVYVGSQFSENVQARAAETPGADSTPSQTAADLKSLSQTTDSKPAQATELEADTPAEDERKIGEYPTSQYAEGWKAYAGKEMEPGPLCDLVGEFGKELTLGEFDAQKLSGMMKAVGKTDQNSINDATEAINKSLEKEGLELNITVGGDGMISQVELKERFKPDQWRTGLKVDGKGAVSTSSVRISLDSIEGPIEKRPISLDQASLLLAKKSSPLSCP